MPENTSDTSFMLGWGFDTQLRDMRIATTFQRALRTATGSGSGRTAMLGWSRGGQLAYAYAALESQLPASDRHVDALVPADTAFNYSPSDTYRPGQCEGYQAGKAALDEGTAAVPFSDYPEVGRRAIRAPQSPSEAIPGLTNRETALVYGASVNDFFNAAFHFLGARFDAAGTPTSLRYTAERRWYRLMTQTAAWESQRTFVDGAALFCGDVDVPFDDHISEVRIPVLYLTAVGGFGKTGNYSTTLVGSRDVSRHIVRLQSPGQEVNDFGHLDLWTATNAPEAAWRPLLRWLRQH